MKIQSKVVFGQQAVHIFEETNDIGAVEQSGEGVIVTHTFNSEAEYDAYLQGIADMEDWYAYVAIDPVITETPDCPHCESWRTYFSDRESKTYCPDCGKQIINLTKGEYETIEFNEKHYPIRTLCVDGVFDGCIIGTEELQTQIMTTEGNYTSAEAEQIDLKILFYVSENKFALSDKELSEYVNQEMK